MRILQISALAAATTAALLPALPAAAEPVELDIQTLTVGAPCAPAEVNRAGVAANGTSVRCVAGLTTAGPAWEPDSQGVQQIGRLQGQGLNVVVTRTGTPGAGCTVTSAAAPGDAAAAPNTINLTLNCPTGAGAPGGPGAPGLPGAPAVP